MAKILIIDDDQLILGYFKRIQEKLENEVVTASDAEKGCQMAQDPDVKLIIMDFCMPGGLEKTSLLKKLKSLRPELPVIVISGFSTQEVVEECYKLGASEFLSKPFELSFLPVIIRRLLDATPMWF